MDIREAEYGLIYRYYLSWIVSHIQILSELNSVSYTDIVRAEESLIYR